MRLNRFWAVFAVLILVGTSAFAQVSSSLTGNITMDGNGLPGVTVTISSPNMQGTRTAVTDVNGNYNFGAIPPGDYTVRAELSGMQTVTRKVHVGLGQTGRVDAEMKMTGVAETITVTAASPVTAALESTEVATNVQQQTVQQLPMRRDIVNVGNLAPGVNANTPSANQLIISGAPASDNLYLVNGAVVNENVRSQVHNLFIEDAIQETTIQTAGISAEYGRFTGGVVSAITKSGGNEFSGSLRDNLENQKWIAKSAYAGEPDHLDKIRSVYEGTLGGRIVRDRLWFFLAGRSYETPTQTTLFALGSEATAPYTTTDKENRYEAKLTGQITPKHSLMASYLNSDRSQQNYCFSTCSEFSAIDPSRSTPSSFITSHYNGVLTNSWLLEAGYSSKKFTFENSGGDYSDFVRGTWGYDLNSGAFFGAPVFCGFCDPEERNNRNFNVKTTYYLATKGIGSHNLIAGYDDFAEQRKANNYQSGSNFEVYTYNSPDRAADGTVMPIIDAGDWIQWTPILQLSKGSNIATKSFYVNDKWDLNQHLNFNVGARYDQNNVTDSSGRKTANDSKVSPRLGIVYDIAGNGRIRLNANYGTYVAHIQETIGGSGASGAGNPAYIQYEYRGPTISGLPTQQAFQQLYSWFQSQGGTDATDLIVGASFPGVSTVIEHPLKSPSVNEWTVGAGLQLGSAGYLRGDWVDRNYKNYYRVRTDLTTGQVTDPMGQLSDLGVIENSSDLKRTYSAAILQAAYRLGARLNLGGNYTWSKTEGNFTAETSGNGPVTDASMSYPEFKAFAQNHPMGYLPEDQRHKVRLFGTYDLPTPIGSFTFGLLERYDSGTPYSAVGSVYQITNYNNLASVAQEYANLPASAARPSYYFGGRGAYRWDNVTATDLSVTYNLPISRLNLWVKGDLVNAFNEQAQISGNTTVLTGTSSSCVQNVGANAGKRCAAFNPFTETPQLGVNYRFGSSFGQARRAADYQAPRTYRFAVGVRF